MWLINVLVVSSLLAVVRARSFYMVNECDHKVWFGLVAGSTSPMIFPANGNYELAPNGGKNSVPIPAGGWSGVIGGRTNCTDAGCLTADCGGGVGGCLPGRGFMQPATQAEFTVIPTSVDFYDVEVINGINLPVSITPSVPADNKDDPYYCGTPGTLVPSPGLGSCSWDLQPPAVEYRWVEAGGASCKADSDCGSSLCGLSFNPGHEQLLRTTCGNLLGYWSANQICGVQRDFGAPFFCSEMVPDQQVTWWNLMACVDVGSCYQPDATTSCCGCVNWDMYGLPVPGLPYTKTCLAENAQWVKNVLPQLAWLKTACPTAYTYPYDDMSSTYTCSSAAPGVTNEVDYTITFCPNNKRK